MAAETSIRLHLHRHTFEVTQIGEKQISGLMKDVINVMPLDTVEVDFVANNPGDTLWHCHQQLHMDYGFMQLIKYSGDSKGTRDSTGRTIRQRNSAQMDESVEYG